MGTRQRLVLPACYRDSCSQGQPVGFGVANGKGLSEVIQYVRGYTLKDQDTRG